MNTVTNYYTRTQTERLLAAWGVSEPLPSRGKSVLVAHPDGGAHEITGSDGRGTDREKLFSVRHTPSPRAVIFRYEQTEAPFEVMARCRVRGQSGFAFRTPLGDRLEQVAFIPDRTRRMFNRNGFGGTSAKFGSVTDVSPCTAADRETYRLWVSRFTAGFRPEDPAPLNEATVEAFSAFVKQWGNQAEITSYLRHFLRSDTSVDMLVAATAGQKDEELARRFADLHPARREELCLRLAPLLPAEEPPVAGITR